MPSSQDIVWAWLIRAQLWPTWYPNSANVQIIGSQTSDLAIDTRFSWKTFGLKVESQVMEFLPPKRLAWDAHTRGFDGYHAWLIEKNEAGCHVLTEETQHGLLPRIQKLFSPKRMNNQHQVWLESLREQASKGYP